MGPINSISKNTTTTNRSKRRLSPPLCTSLQMSWFNVVTGSDQIKIMVQAEYLKSNPNIQLQGQRPKHDLTMIETKTSSRAYKQYCVHVMEELRNI